MSTVSIRKSTDYENIRATIQQNIDDLGGIDKFVSRGDKVLVKPNMVMGFAVEKAVTTHPSIVRAVCEILLGAGCSVKMGESPGIGSAANVAKKCGIADAIADLDVEIVEFTPTDSHNENFQYKHLSVAKELLEADAIINLPKLKTHCMMFMTMAVKNMFGAVCGMQKFQWHYRAGKDKDQFARMLYEIHQATKPTLSIIDAVVGMDGDGPTGGEPHALGFIGASTDACSLDAACMDILKLDKDKLFTLEAAKSAGDTEWQNYEIIGDAADSFNITNWTLPRTASLEVIQILEKIPFISKWLRKQLTALPFAVDNKCKRCGECVRVCPATAMTLENNQIKIDEQKCIRCYCCHELCPFHAMDLRKGILGRIFGKR